MGVLANLSVFAGRIFGTEKALDTVVESTVKGLDALVYTNQERANDSAAERSEARKMVVQWMEATKGQNLARRLIALSITGVWLLMYLLSAFCSMLAIFVNSEGLVTGEKMRAVSEIAQINAQDMNSAVMLILAFYFAAPHMGNIAEAVIGKSSARAAKG